VAWVRETLALLAIPGLGTFGLVPEQDAGIAAQALRSSSMQGNPVALTEGDLCAILARAA
jgi:outer membrane PBP1 activator LpoA protein